MACLEIDKLEIRNFLSYGDYETALKISDLGPVLISSPNGSGKSSLLTAIIWCLFGRTISNSSPGDKIINWDVDGGCYVKIITKNGYEILRTRNLNGHSDLKLKRNNVEITRSTNNTVQDDIYNIFNLDYEIFISSVFCGQFGKSFLELTPIKRKEAIEKLLGVDKINNYASIAKEKCHEIELKQEKLRSSITLTDNDIKQIEYKIIENKKLFDKFNIKIEESKKDLNLKIEEFNGKLSCIKLLNIIELKKKCDGNNRIKLALSDSNAKLLIAKNELARSVLEHSNLNSRIKNIKLFDVPNIDILTELHKKADESEKKLEENRKLIKDLEYENRSIKSELASLNADALLLMNQVNKICNNCFQMVNSDHVDSIKTNTMDKKVLELSERLRLNNLKIKGLSELGIVVNRPDFSIREVNSLIERNKKIEVERDELSVKSVELSTILNNNLGKCEDIADIIRRLEKAYDKNIDGELQNALTIKSEYDMCVLEIDRLKDKLVSLNHQNPYGLIVAEYEKSLAGKTDNKNRDELEISKLNDLYDHYNYVSKSYSDRKKIKSWLLSDMIPYLNNRIAHYLSSFDINISITFDAALSDNTDKWDYEFCSGGERKRIDLSMMFALYDLYITMYGKQCNLMVLDEVDGRLDADGIQSFFNIINELCSADSKFSPETILVVSHRPELKDLFPSQINIKKENGLSYIVK